MGSLITYKDIHTSSLQLLSSLLKQCSYTLSSSSSSNSPPIHVTMSTVTPAYTTTQVLFPNTESCILPQRIIDLSMLLQNSSSKNQVISNGIGPLRPKTMNKGFGKSEPPAAEQPKKPLWIESHSYRRSARTNSDNLRILTAELNMMRALKITGSLKPRRSYLPKRNDEFLWGRPSSLRNTTTL